MIKQNRRACTKETRSNFTVGLNNGFFPLCCAQPSIVFIELDVRNNHLEKTAPWDSKIKQNINLQSG